jgi:hypothetical protein
LWIEHASPVFDALGHRGFDGLRVEYYPGEEHVFDDAGVRGNLYAVEALHGDDEGAAILARLRAEFEAPATVAGFNPNASAIIDRAFEEDLRRRGRFRALVLRQVAGGVDPTKADLDAALFEASGDPLPRALVEYATKVTSRKRGPKPSRTTSDDMDVRARYAHELRKARAEDTAERSGACRADGRDDEHPPSRAVKTRALERTARALRRGMSTVQRILRSAPSHIHKSR